MNQFLASPLADLLLWIGVLIVCIFVAVSLISKLRHNRDNPPAKASELMSDFREIHAQGGLSDEEFRTIKSMLADQLQEEMKDHKAI